jgi:hypothetical protein
VNGTYWKLCGNQETLLGRFGNKCFPIPTRIKKFLSRGTMASREAGSVVGCH